MHGQKIEQAHQGEKPVYLAVLAAGDRKPAALGRQALVGIDKKVHAGRVHERDLAQIQDDRTAALLENRREDLAQPADGREIDLAADTQHGCLLIARIDREAPYRQRAARALRQVG